MINNILRYFSIVYIVSSLASCEPCLDCNPDNAYPFVYMEFFNRTSYETLIENRDSVNNLIPQLEKELLNPEYNTTQLDSIENVLNSAIRSLQTIQQKIADTNNKLIKIDSLNGRSRVFFDAENEKDSFSLFKLPLDIYQDSAFFRFKIDSYEAELALAYERLTDVRDNKVKELTHSLQLAYHSFDSLSVRRNCRNDSLCFTDKVTIYVEL